MSDMLQLVVEIHNTQALILPVTSHIESSQSRGQAEAYRTLMPTSAGTSAGASPLFQAGADESPAN